VKAKECTHKAIMESIMAGSFYASTGPEIYDFYVEDGVIHVECSPCERIMFSGNNRQHQYHLGENLTKLSRKLRGSEEYVRVSVCDKYGRTAWGNPIYL
jgi:hypothetical protein